MPTRAPIAASANAEEVIAEDEPEDQPAESGRDGARKLDAVEQERRRERGGDCEQQLEDADGTDAKHLPGQQFAWRDAGQAHLDHTAALLLDDALGDCAAMEHQRDQEDDQPKRAAA